MPLLTLRIDSPGAAIGHAQAELRRFLAARGVAEHAIGRAELVLEEVARNALLHGQASVVDVTAWPLADGCSLRIEDRGAPFDASTAPLQPRHADLVGGHGLRLIRASCDRLSYARLPPGINRLDAEILAR